MSTFKNYRFSYKALSVVIPLFLIVSIVALLGISSNKKSIFASAAIYSIKVVNEFPHDPNAFTQGLLYAGNDTLFESTGLYGQSSVRKVDIRSGKVEMIQKMDRLYFGEGLTLLGERLFQVTWLTKTGFIYDRNNLSKFEIFSHQMQDGWGLATDGNVLFGSDGTSTLYHIDPQTLKVIVKHTVKYNDREVRNLNELEFVNGEVWANVWQTDCIARISRTNGIVLGWILLPNLRQGLIAAGKTGIDVLNGIAWDDDNRRLFVTGKLWPKLYEIKLHPIKKHFDVGAIEQLCL
ncbi:Glu_cyclase_2 domain-containing protein, partial [Cephalotus follicularis]